MSCESEKLNLLIVGATGQLGSSITKHCLAKPNLMVNILVPDPEKNQELITQVEKAGGKVILADLTSPETLDDCSKGMHTVVSAFGSTNRKAFMEGQMALINDCIKNGVQRYVPSEFGGNLENFPGEDLAVFPISQAKMELYDYVKNLPIKILRFSQGLMMETFFALQTQGLVYWGDPNFVYDLTCYEDIAKVTAEAVSRPDQSGHIVFVANELTIGEITDIYNKVRGTNIVPKRLGALADLYHLHEVHKRIGDEAAVFISGAKLLLYDDRSCFDKNNNSDFLEVKPTTLEEFLQKNSELKLV